MKRIVLLTTLVLTLPIVSLRADSTDKLVGKLKSKDPSTRQLAAMELGSMGADAKPAVPELARVLSGDPKPEVRQACAVALGMLGKHGRGAVGDLMKAVSDDSSPLVRAEAATSLGKVDPTNTRVLSALRGATRDKHPTVRAAAQDTLKQLGKD